MVFAGSDTHRPTHRKEVPLDIKDSNFEPANDNDYEEAVLIYEDKKFAEDVYEKLSLHELVDRLIMYVGHLPNLLIHTKYDSKGNKVENLEIKDRQAKLKTEFEKIQEKFGNLDFIDNSKVLNQLELQNFFREIYKFIYSVEVSSELYKEENYVLSIIDKLKRIINKKMDEYYSVGDFYLNKKNISLESFIEKYSKKYSFEKEDLLNWLKITDGDSLEDLMEDPFLKWRIIDEKERSVFLKDFLELNENIKKEIN